MILKTSLKLLPSKNKENYKKDVRRLIPLKYPLKK